MNGGAFCTHRLRAVQVLPHCGRWRYECFADVPHNGPWPLRVRQVLSGEDWARRPGCPGLLLSAIQECGQGEEYPLAGLSI